MLTRATNGEITLACCEGYDKPNSKPGKLATIKRPFGGLEYVAYGNEMAKESFST